MKKAKASELLENYIGATFAGVVGQANALSSMKHKLTQGELNEIFLQNLLKHFLPAYLSAGSGVVINNKGEQSKQTDIVVYDNRVLPLFLHSDNLNVYAVEALVSTIEVKSTLTLSHVKSAEKNANHLIKEVWERNNWLGVGIGHRLPPLCSVFGFSGSRIRNLSTDDNSWIKQNISHVSLICSVGKFSWARVDRKWTYGGADEEYSEIRRYIALLVDNLRTVANSNLGFELSVELHKDWLGQYIRYL